MQVQLIFHFSQYYLVFSAFLFPKEPEVQKYFQGSVHSSKIPSCIVANTKLSSRFTVGLYNPFNWKILVTVLPVGQNDWTIFSS